MRELQYQGGTIFGSSRGGFDKDKIIESLLKKGINQLYVIGGDGTHRGIAAQKGAGGCRRRSSRLPDDGG